MENIESLRAKSCFRFHVVERLFAKGAEIENWISRHEAELPIPPYTSIDIRDSGFKALPVDSNAFPGGFNNICHEDWPVAACNFAKVLRAHGKKPKRVLLIPENHTNNADYFENLRALREMLVLAGFETTIGHFNSALADNFEPGVSQVTTALGHQLILERLERKGNLLSSRRQNFDASDLVLLNNDLSNGMPPELEGIENEVTPSAAMGWFRRRKTTHMRHYCELAHELAKILEIDPFLITARFTEVDGIDFDSGQGLDLLATKVDEIRAQIVKDYAAHGIEADPFVYVKHNSGTYGRAIMPVKDGSEILALNRREKNKMNVSKGGIQVDSVVVMEGIPTDLTLDNQTAEPVIYLVGHQPVGGFLRLNPNKDNRGNLNAPGAHFKTLCFANLFRNPNPESIVLEKFYGVLGRLSSLANAREMQG
jgi:glutamate--cysteine ligase